MFNPFKTTLIILIRIYQLIISPFLTQSCRFYPTCSAYGIQALEHYGALKGSYLIIKRLLKCHPFHPGGIDSISSKDIGNT